MSNFDEQQYIRNAERDARNRPAPWADVGGRAMRGGQVRSIVGATVTIKLYLEPNWIGDRTCLAGVFQGHSPVVGSPVCCEVNQSANYAIVAVYPAAPADHAAEAAWMKDHATFSPGRVMPEQGGNPERGSR